MVKDKGGDMMDMLIQDFYDKTKIIGFWKTKNIFINNAFTNKIEMLNLKEAKEDYRSNANSFCWGDLSDGTELLSYALIKFFCCGSVAQHLAKRYLNFFSLLPQDNFEIYASKIQSFILENLYMEV